MAKFNQEQERKNRSRDESVKGMMDGDISGLPAETEQYDANTAAPG